MNFFDKIEQRSREIDSLLCVGIDPVLDVKRDVKTPEKAYSELVDFSERIINATAEYALCYKPNIAFFEVYGSEGMRALEQVMKIIPADIPVIIDSKRSDIGNTAKAYADSIFGHLNADATTLSPYMGRDAVDPFLEYNGRGLFLLCRTTNPGAPAVQDIQVDLPNGEKGPLYLKMAAECTSWSKDIGLVVAGNDIEALQNVRAMCPDAWFLSPGIGSQGGSMDESVAAGRRADGLGIIPNVSRSIANSDNPAKTASDFCERMRKADKKAFNISTGSIKSNKNTAAKKIRVEDTHAERSRLGLTSESGNHGEEGSKRDLETLKSVVLKGMIGEECFRVGEFVLKSGKRSPFYIDMRKISSRPSLLKNVARAYAALCVDLDFDRIAGIPVAALPFATALSLELDIPMIYPRISKKGHGTGNLIEGHFKKGEKILLLDDLITTGKSKIEAVEILRDAGLIVEDLVVLIERGAQGRKDMESDGIELHSFAQLEEFLNPCYEMGLIDRDKRDSLIEYASKE